jgi:hypothetical protein
MSNLETCSTEVGKILPFFLNEDGTPKTNFEEIRTELSNKINLSASTPEIQAQFHAMFDEAVRHIQRMALGQRGGVLTPGQRAARQNLQAARGFTRSNNGIPLGGFCAALTALAGFIIAFQMFVPKGGYHKNKKIRSTKKKQNRKQRKQSRRQ